MVLSGVSGGSIVSLLTAFRFPEAVKGVVLIWPPSDSLDLYDMYLRGGYIEPAELAEEEGMQAVIDRDVSMGAWKTLAEKNPQAKEQLLSMDPKEFSQKMRNGAQHFPSNLHFSGLSDVQVQRITTPTLVISGNDDSHPLHVSEKLGSLLPKSKVIKPSEHFSEEVGDALIRMRMNEDENAIGKIEREMAFNAPFIVGFVAGIETA